VWQKNQGVCGNRHLHSNRDTPPQTPQHTPQHQNGVKIRRKAAGVISHGKEGRKTEYHFFRQSIPNRDGHRGLEGEIFFVGGREREKVSTKRGSLPVINAGQSRGGI